MAVKYFGTYSVQWHFCFSASVRSTRTTERPATCKIWLKFLCSLPILLDRCMFFSVYNHEAVIWLINDCRHAVLNFLFFLGLQRRDVWRKTLMMNDEERHHSTSAWIFFLVSPGVSSQSCFRRELQNPYILSINPAPHPKPAHHHITHHTSNQFQPFL